MSDSVRPHRWQPTRLPRPWDSPSKNTGVGCHFLLQCIKVKSESEVSQSCPTLATPWTTAHQAPPSMGFSRQEYWSGVPLPSPTDPVPYIICKKFTGLLCLFLYSPQVLSEPDILEQSRQTGFRLQSHDCGQRVSSLSFNFFICNVEIMIPNNLFD